MDEGVMPTSPRNRGFNSPSLYELMVRF